MRAVSPPSAHILSCNPPLSSSSAGTELKKKKKKHVKEIYFSGCRVLDLQISCINIEVRSSQLILFSSVSLNGVIMVEIWLIWSMFIMILLTNSLWWIKGCCSDIVIVSLPVSPSKESYSCKLSLMHRGGPWAMCYDFWKLILNDTSLTVLL